MNWHRCCSIGFHQIHRVSRSVRIKMRVDTVPKFMVALERSQLLHPRILSQNREQVANASPNLAVEDLMNSMLKACV